MNQNIKKIFSKKIIITIVILLILGASFGGFYFYKQHQKLEKNGKFVMDVVLALENIYDSRWLENDTGKEIKDEELKLLQQAYQRKDDITEAKLIMEKWRNDSDEDRKNFARNMLKGIVDLDTASDAFIKFARDYKKGDLALFRYKSKKGGGEIFMTMSMFTMFPNRIMLSPSSEKSLVEYIDLTFKNPIENYKENKNKKNFSQPDEVSTVILLRNKYAKDLGLPTI